MNSFREIARFFVTSVWDVWGNEVGERAGYEVVLDGRALNNISKIFFSLPSSGETLWVFACREVM